MEPGEEEFDYLETIKRNIDNAAGYIEHEQEQVQGRNSWLDCFTTRLNVISVSLTMAKRQGKISLEDYARYKDRVKNLTVKRIDLGQEFPTDNLPEDKKEELLKQLNIFAEPEEEGTPR